MPGRNIPLSNNEIYHVLNRGITSQKVFNSERDYFQFIDRMNYYQNASLPMSYAQLLDLPPSIRVDLLEQIQLNNEHLVEIMAYCLMPNHFHLILKQDIDNGISDFMANLTNGYTRYYNIKHHRLGPILQGRFKAIPIKSDEQLIHLLRYIHSNPYSAGLVETLPELKKYPYSSLCELFFGRERFCNTGIIMEHFGNPATYWKFIADNADYQKSLQIIKSLLLES